MLKLSHRNIKVMRFFKKKTKQTFAKIMTSVLVVSFVLSTSYTGGGFSLETKVAEAAFNKEINYQGKLTNSSNVAVADGTYHMKFWLLTSPTAATTTAIWVEDRSTAPGDRITVSNGLFSVMLGSSTPLTTVDFNQTLYLGVEIGGSAGSVSWDGEMSPRKKLGAVPAAFEADKLDSLSSEQFLRSDAVNSTSTATTFLTITQNGAGKIAEFIGPSSAPVFNIASTGAVNVGTSTGYGRFNVWGAGTGTGILANFVNNASTTVMKILDNGTIGFGTTSPQTKFHFFTTIGGNEMIFESTASDSEGASLMLRQTSTSPEVGDSPGAIVFNGRNSSASGGYHDYADISGIILDPTFGSADGGLWLGVLSSGSMISALRLNPTESIFNYEQQDMNFRVNGVTDTHLLFADASTNNVGIGTSSPYAKLSVVGQVVASHYTATTTTASTLPYASTTALTVSGTNGLQLATGLNGPLQANAGLVSATTSIGVLYGGTGLTSAPSYGQLLLGNSSSGYTLSATSSLGLLGSSTVSSLTSNYVPKWGGSAFSNSLIYDTGTNVGIGTTSPYAKLSVVGEVVAPFYTATSTTATSSFMGAFSIGSTTPYSTAMLSVGTSTPILSVTKDRKVNLGQLPECAYLDTGVNGAIDCAPATSYKMEQIYGRFVNEDAAVFFIGDSTGAGGNTPRWAQSIIRKWDVPWVGFVAGQFESSSPDEGFQTFSQDADLTVPAEAFEDGSGTNETIFNFHEVNNTGGNLIYLWLTSLDKYFRGDWTMDKQMMARSILHLPLDTGDQPGANTTIYTRMSSSNSYETTGSFNISSTYEAVEKSFGAPNYKQNTQLEFQVAQFFTSPSIHTGAVEFYAPGKKGFSLWQAGVSGAHTYDWIHQEDDARGNYTETQIQNSLGLVARKINTFIVQLGINGSSDESISDGGALYKSRIENVIDNWKADAEAAGGTDIKFLLINPWYTSQESGTEWSVMRGQVLLQIAHERDYVSFIDMNKLLLENYGANWWNTLMEDGIHQNQAGVNAIGELSWKEISKGKSMLWSAAGREILKNPNLTSGTSWTAANDCSLTSNAGTCTFSGGAASTITQASTAFVEPPKGGKWYKLTYTMSGITSTPDAAITTGFADIQTSLEMTNGTHVTYVRSKAAPGDFVITTTLTAGKAFTIDSLSLQEMEDNNLVVNGSITGGGLSGLKITSGGNVGIGTTSPYARLSVVGEFGATSTPSFVVATSTGSTTHAVQFIIDRLGNVGIGTSSPFGKFSLHALTTDDMAVPIFNIASSTASATTSLFTITRQGNVGIGTTSPYAKLSVVGEVVASNYTATSTTATSTFAYDVSVAGRLSVLQSSTLATIIGNTTGDARGSGALDIQSSRTGTTRVASGSGSVAVGISNLVSLANSSAVGYGNTVSGAGEGGPSSAFGYNNTVSFDDSMAFGNTNTVTSGVAFGYGNSASNAGPGVSTYSSAFGANNISSGGEGAAFGVANISSSIGSAAFGTSNLASGLSGDSLTGHSSAFGTNNVATGVRSSAFGTLNKTYALNSVVVGNRNFTSSDGLSSVAVGLMNNQTGGTLNFVTGEITGTATGTATIGRLSSAFGIANTVSGNLSQAFGFSNTVTSASSSAFGHYITNSVASSTQIGPGDDSKITILGSTDSKGFVGIGTTSPYAKLSVVGEVVASNFTATSTVAASTFPYASTTALTVSGKAFFPGSSSWSSTNVAIGTTSPWALLSLNPDDISGPSFAIGSTTSTHFVVTNGGLVGIGNANPTVPLSFAAAAGLKVLLYPVTATTGYGFGIGSGLLQIFADNNQRVGIGTGGFTETFSVNGTAAGSGSTTPWGKLSAQSTVTTVPTLALKSITAQTANIIDVYSNAGTSGLFSVGISPDFRVGIGTTSPSAKLSVNASSTVPFFLVGSSTATHLMVDTTGNVGIGTTSPWRKLSVSGTVAFNGLDTTQGNAICITAGKEITDPGAAACTGSSIRFKENVETLSEGFALDKINQLRVVSFDYKDGFYSPEDSRASYGLIAEEVEEIDPNLVDYGYDGLPTTLKFEKILGLTVQAVQELSRGGGFANGVGGLSLAAVLNSLKDLGADISDGLAKFKNLVVETLTVGSSEKPTGITLFDEKTGEPYCLTISSGKIKNIPGECKDKQEEDQGGDITPAIEVENATNIITAPIDDEAGGGNVTAGTDGPGTTGGDDAGDDTADEGGDDQISDDDEGQDDGDDNDSDEGNDDGGDTAEPTI